MQNAKYPFILSLSKRDKPLKAFPLFASLPDLNSMNEKEKNGRAKGHHLLKIMDRMNDEWGSKLKCTKRKYQQKNIHRITFPILGQSENICLVTINFVSIHFKVDALHFLGTCDDKSTEFIGRTSDPFWF